MGEPARWRDLPAIGSFRVVPEIIGVGEDDAGAWLATTGLHGENPVSALSRTRQSPRSGSACVTSTSRPRREPVRSRGRRMTESSARSVVTSMVSTIRTVWHETHPSRHPRGCARDRRERAPGRAACRVRPRPVRTQHDRRRRSLVRARRTRFPRPATGGPTSPSRHGVWNGTMDQGGSEPCSTPTKVSPTRETNRLLQTTLGPLVAISQSSTPGCRRRPARKRNGHRTPRQAVTSTNAYPSGRSLPLIVSAPGGATDGSSSLSSSPRPHATCQPPPVPYHAILLSQEPGPAIARKCRLVMVIRGSRIWRQVAQ